MEVTTRLNSKDKEENNFIGILRDLVRKMVNECFENDSQQS